MNEGSRLAVQGRRDVGNNFSNNRMGKNGHSGRMNHWNSRPDFRRAQNNSTVASFFFFF